MLVAIDIETESVTEDRDDALIPHLSRITCVGVWCPQFQKVYRNLDEFQAFLDKSPEALFVGQNLKFDIKHLLHSGIKFPIEQWREDTQLMAASHTEKIPDEWLEVYEEKRKIANKKLPVGYSHRKAGRHSLKSLAPYFLKVEPFWEDPSNHDNNDYVLKDCAYTWHLCNLLKEKMLKLGTYDFYQKKLLPWTKMLLQAEHRGIRIDVEAIKNLLIKTKENVQTLEQKLDLLFKPAYELYYRNQVEDLKELYTKKRIIAIERLKQPSEIKTFNVIERYNKLLNHAMDKIPLKMNLASPSQLLWIMRDFFKLDCRDFNDEESTGIEVLETLKNKHEAIETLISYREQNKLATAFLPTYLKLETGQAIKTTFHADGTRTGRLSSSDPNLQQVASSLHSLFKARSGYKLITKDMSAIEPHLIAYYSEDAEVFYKVKEFHANNVRVFFGIEGTKKEIKDSYPAEYALAKEIGLAILYGAGSRRVEQSARKHGFKWEFFKCRELVQNLKEAYPDIFKFKEALDQKASKGPYKNLFGRTINFDNPEDIYMKAFNTLIQSSASDMVINSAWKIMNRFKELAIDGHVLLLVHDELVIEVVENQLDSANRVIEEIMTSYDLPTKLGPIKLEVEGRTSDCWEK